MVSIDYTIDTSELLKDSALAPEHKCAFKFLYGKDNPKCESYERRVIVEYLNGSEYAAREKIMECQMGYRAKKDVTAILCLKEKELNTKGRVFVKQTYSQRLVQVSREQILAKGVLSFFKEQTMTDSELKQLKKLGGATRIISDNFININLDLQKWNHTFRPRLVNPFGRILDDMYDTGVLYATSHNWFLECVSLPNDRLHHLIIHIMLKTIQYQFQENIVTIIIKVVLMECTKNSGH